MWYFWKFVDAAAFALGMPLLLAGAGMFLVSQFAMKKHRSLKHSNGER
jgi:hypothetical protein